MGSLHCGLVRGRESGRWTRWWEGTGACIRRIRVPYKDIDACLQERGGSERMAGVSCSSIEHRASSVGQSKARVRGRE